MLDVGPREPLRLIVGEEHFELAETIGTRDQFLRLKSLLDGRHSLNQIAQQMGLDRATVVDVVESLSEAGLLRREEPILVIPRQQFREKLTATLTMWRRQIGYHRLFALLASGQARLQVLQGLFIETYHVVRLSSLHIAVALSSAATDEERTILAGYLNDEAHHAPLLLDTCVRLGCRAEDVEAAQPTIGTTSLVGMLCELGRRDILAYLASTCLFEALPDDYEEGRGAAHELVRSYGLASDALDPALEHLRVDANSQHASILDRVLEYTGDMPAGRAHSIVNYLHDLKHAYDQHHDAILQYYSDISNYVPRPKVDYFSL